MSKKIISLLLSVIFIIALFPCNALAADCESLNVAVISDLHVLPKDLIKNTDDFNNYLASDLKMISESEAILDAMISEISKSDLDVLLIPGDLSCNGEFVSHQLVSAKLAQLKADKPELTILVTSGNHDINKTGKNYNTSNGKAVSVASTSIAQFKELYSFCFNDECVAEQFGGDNLSYVARIGGYSFIVIDSNDYGNVDGKLSDELQAWIKAKASEARSRGEALVAMMHHGLVAHDALEPSALGDFLVDDYINISTSFADSGINMVFTGHYHTNDIASFTTLKGNTIYDIATGSMVVYPSPIRFVSLQKSGSSVSASLSTRTGISVPSFVNPYTGTVQEIANLTDYGWNFGYDAESVRYLAQRNVEKAVRKYLTSNSSDADWMLDKLDPKFDSFVSKAVEVKVDSNHTVLDVVNYVLFTNHAGSENGKYPDWMKTAIKNLSNGKIITKIMDIARQEAFSDRKSKLRFNLFCTSVTGVVVGNAALAVMDNYCNDKNCKEDNNTVISFSITPKTSALSKFRR